MSKQPTDWQDVNDWQDIGSIMEPPKSPARVALEQPDYLKSSRGYIPNPANPNPRKAGKITARDDKGKVYEINLPENVVTALVPGLIEGNIRNRPENQASIIKRLKSTPLDIIPGMEGQTAGNLAEGLESSPGGQVVIGAAKDMGGTAYNLLKMARDNNRIDGVPSSLPDEKPAFLNPEGTPQKVGAGLSTAAQFMAPSMAAGKIPAYAKSGLAVRALAEGLMSGAVSKARGESNQQAMGNAYSTGAITAALGVAGKLAGPLGERIELALLKPLKADLADVKGPPELAPQTMIKNLYKYDLGGTLPQSYQKTQALTKDLGQQLRTALGSNPQANVDVLDALIDTQAELSKTAAANYGTNKEIANVLNKLYDDLSNITASGKVNLADAQDIKQALGAMGAWTNGMRDAESTATEKVANTMYSKLKTAIENASGQSAEVRAINEKFGEVIPIKNALLRRIPVAARREPVSLKEFIALTTGGVSGIGLAGADRLLRSGSMANALVQAGKNPAANAAKVAPGLTGAMDSLIQNLQKR